MSDSELSGYEGDVEQGTCHCPEVGESCDEATEESQLLQSMTTYFVPVEVQQRLWTTRPLQHCIRLLQENTSRGISPCKLFSLNTIYLVQRVENYLYHQTDN